MKIIAWTRCHYGLDYLSYVIRSTAGFAFRHIVLYTPTASMGFNGSGEPCPDKRDDLLRAARDAGGKRMLWVEDMEPSLTSAMSIYPDADLFLELDADEIPYPRLLDNIYSRMDNGRLTARFYRLPFLHHWRSFGYVCRDGSWPSRLCLPRNYNQETRFWPDGDQFGFVHHFGYARRIPDMLYKVALSAHKPEFRPGWWEDTFLKFPERLTDLHPVSNNGFWNAEPFNRVNLPPVMVGHPYYGLDKVE